MKYTATFRINLGKAIPAVGELTDSINATLTTFGIEDKLSVHADAFNIDVTVDRPLTETEQHQMGTLLEAEIIRAMPKYDVRLTSLRSQSVTPELSAS